MEQNNTGRYFKYAIGEIILVVIGILIALQINNWNENRKIKAVETSYLKRLVVDLNENKNLWEETLIRKKKQLQSTEIFLNFRFSNNKDTIYKIMPYFEAIGVWTDININQVTFNELVSSGNLNIISNDSIKLKLLALDKLYKGILNVQNTLEIEHRARIHEPLMNSLNSTNLLPLDPNMSDILKREFTAQEKEVYYNTFKNEMSILIEDKTFLNGLIGIVYNAEHQFSAFEKAGNEVDNLISLINTELSND